jgi:hypothetical protein
MYPILNPLDFFFRSAFNFFAYWKHKIPTVDTCPLDYFGTRPIRYDLWGASG